jgi:tetratricopeptide (TPR) repeat protein
MAYLKNQQYQEALLEFKNVLQIDPKDADGHYQLALTYLKLGSFPDVQAAFGELRRTVEIDPANRDAQLKLGELYLLSREPVKARERADLILASTPRDPDGLILRGRSLIGLQDFQQGILELKKALELDPKNVRIYLDLARAYAQMKDYAAAEATLNQAVTAMPQSTDARLALGDLRLMSGHPDAAEAEYRRALEMAPDNDMLYQKLAAFYQLGHKWVDAESTYLLLASRKTTDERPQILLGDFYTEMGDRDKALSSFQRAQKINPNSTIVRDRLLTHYLDTGKLDEAEQRVKAILDKNGKDPAGRFFDARLRLARGKLDEAMQLLQEVVRDEPKFAPAHEYMGLAYMMKNDVSQARRELNEAVQLVPTSAPVRTELAALYLSDGSYDLAVTEAQIAIRLNPRNLQAITILGDAYLRKGDLAKGRQVFETLAKAFPKDPFSHYRLGLIARAERNDPNALSHFEEALLGNPQYIDALTQIAAIRLTQGKPNEARERVHKQLDVAPKNPMLYNLLGRLWMQAKDFSLAEEAFKKAIELDPSVPLSYMNLAETYSHTGRLEEAAREYEAVLKTNPKVASAHALLGMIYEKRKDTGKARVHYQEALKLDPKFAPAANNLAWIYGEEGGDIDQALTLAQTARKQLPQDPSVADTLGWLYYKKNAYLRAIGFLKEAAEKMPDNPVIQYHLGMAYYKNGNTVPAKKALQLSLKLNPGFAGAAEAQQVLKGIKEL